MEIRCSILRPCKHCLTLQTDKKSIDLLGWNHLRKLYKLRPRFEPNFDSSVTVNYCQHLKGNSRRVLALCKKESRRLFNFLSRQRTHRRWKLVLTENTVIVAKSLVTALGTIELYIIRRLIRLSLLMSFKLIQFLNNYESASKLGTEFANTTY